MGFMKLHPGKQLFVGAVKKRFLREAEAGGGNGRGESKFSEDGI